VAIRQITSYEVAKAAGVSQSTVSRVFANDRWVKAETRRRVLECAAQLGYRVNNAARALASRRAQTLGMVFYELDYMTKISFGGAVTGFAKSASYAGYNLHFCCSNRNSPIAARQHFLENAREGMLDGVVVMDAAVSDEDILSLDDLGLPFVLIDREIPGREEQSVWNDHFGGSFLIARHLAKEGYSRIAIMGFTTGSTSVVLPHTELRHQGLLHGCGVQPWEIRWSEDSETSLAGRLVELLQSSDRPDAIICTGAEDAVRLLTTAVGLGIRVPEDLGIAAFEDDPVLSASQPEISAVRFHWDTAGEIAGRMLINLLEGKDMQAPPRPLPASLAVRRSTSRSAAPPRTAGLPLQSPRKTASGATGKRPGGGASCAG